MTRTLLLFLLLADPQASVPKTEKTIECLDQKSRWDADMPMCKVIIPRMQKIGWKVVKAQLKCGIDTCWMEYEMRYDARKEKL